MTNAGLHSARMDWLARLISEPLPDTCLIWPGASGTKHLQTRVGRERIGVHRLAYSLFNKVTLDPSTVICHACDVPGCVNPKHLFAGTPKDNVYDCIAKGRFHRSIPPHYHGSKNPAAKLTEEQVKELRLKASGGATYLALSRHFGVSATMIRDIVLRRKWQKVA